MGRSRLIGLFGADRVSRVVAGGRKWSSSRIASWNLAEVSATQRRRRRASVARILRHHAWQLRPENNRGQRVISDGDWRDSVDPLVVSAVRAL